MNNEQKLLKKFKILCEKLKKNQYIVDNNGVKTVEITNCLIENLDPLEPFLNFNVKKTNEKYCEKEILWYLSQNISIKGFMDDIKMWNYSCSKDKEKKVNSNYGWCIFSKENYNQYDFCLNELVKNKNSRRACMIYNRPSMVVDYNKNGMSDFICTFSTQLFIRNNKLIYNVVMRSNDAIYGFFNDFYWHCYVYNKIFNDLKKHYVDLEVGCINWFSVSFHVYERHFDLLNNMCSSD